MAIVNDGHSTTLAFSEDPDIMGIVMFEKEIGPPGMDGGGANDITTMRNTAWRTFAPKKLITLTEVTVTVAYDPVFYNRCVATMKNYPTGFRVRFPDMSQVTFYGYLESFKPNKNVEGAQPTAEMVIRPTNFQSTSFAEAGPTYTA